MTVPWVFFFVRGGRICPWASSSHLLVITYLYPMGKQTLDKEEQCHCVIGRGTSDGAITRVHPWIKVCPEGGGENWASWRIGPWICFSDDSTLTAWDGFGLTSPRCGLWPFNLLEITRSFSSWLPVSPNHLLFISISFSGEPAHSLLWASFFLPLGYDSLSSCGASCCLVRVLDFRYERFSGLNLNFYDKSKEYLQLLCPYSNFFTFHHSLQIQGIMQLQKRKKRNMEKKEDYSC